MENTYVALADMKVGETEVFAAEAELQMDVMEEVDHKGKWGWEVTDEKGNVIDQKYGYNSYEAADKDGEKELKKLIKTHGSVWGADLPQEIQQSYEALSTEEQDRYQKFFKEKLDKYGAGSPADLDDDKKKQLFEEVKKDWK